MKSGVAHDENFPVASWLCPAHLRPVIRQIYWFARTADDIADEGMASASTRLYTLARYKHQLHLIATQQSPTEWHSIFVPLAQHMQTHQLPVQHLEHLLNAFEQDICRTDTGQVYATHHELLQYCQCSANPIGRLLLHLDGIKDAERLAQSDAICSALQLINFWQDVSIDIPRRRHYLPTDALARQGLNHAQAHAFIQTPCMASTHDIDVSQAMQRVMQQLWQQATDLMRQGQGLVHHLSGRLGWELRFVVQGGLEIARQAQTHHFQTWLHRPRIKAWHVPMLLQRAITMRQSF
jgi:squalene synthase HpnC